MAPVIKEARGGGVMSGRMRSSPLPRGCKRRRRRRSAATAIARRISPESEKGTGRRGLLASSHVDSSDGVEDDDKAELLDILYWLGDAPNDGGDGEAPRARGIGRAHV